MRLNSLECHRLKQPSSLEVETMPRVISGELMQPVVWLSLEGHRQVDIARIMGVTQGTISDILKQARWTGSPNQRPLGYHQRISTPLEDLYMLRVMRAKRSLLSPRLRAQIIRRTVCRLSKRTIGVFLLQDSILAGWHDAPDLLKCIVGAVSG